MDYIITGGLGFIGTNLSIKLASINAKFAVLDRLNGFDICEDPISFKECKTLVHLAAFTNVRGSIEWPVTAIRENIKGIVNCLQYAKDTKPHLIFTSSMGAPSSLSPYTASKLACEAICTAYRESYGIEITVLRLANVYGPHSKHKTSVVARFIKSCLEKRDLEIFGNGLQTRDFIHVDDVVRTILGCTKAKVINVGSGIATSVLELAEIIRALSTELTDFTPEIIWKDANRGEIKKVEPRTSILARVNLKTGLELTFKWYVEHYHDKRVE